MELIFGEITARALFNLANKIELEKIFPGEIFFWKKFPPPRRAHRLHFRYFRAPTDVCGENGTTLIS